LVITLEANPSTGYTWELADVNAEAEGEPIVRQTAAIEFEPHSTLLGAPGIQTLRFEAVAEGETTLRLVYRRPWELNVEPARTFSLQVRAIGPFEPLADRTAESTTTASLEPTPFIDVGTQPDLPPSYDWCTLQGCTPVRDQHLCGSCWAFATVASLESSVMIQDGLARDVSEQYLVSCNTEGWACNGGWWAHNYHAWKVPPGEAEAGAVSEGEFPYLARDEPCDPPHAHQEKLDSWHHVGDEWSVPAVAAIRQAIYEHGPVAAAVCVGPAFQSYQGGVFETHECAAVNHAILLVGWDDTQGTDGVWLLRNSWGPDWGEEGYMRIGYGVSNVGFGANYVVYSPSGCYGLTTEVSPSGSGSITAEPSPNCGFSSYDPGTEIGLTANPAPGWYFTGWSGDVTASSSQATVTMDGRKSATGHFRPEVCGAWVLPGIVLSGCWLAVRARRT
jgi:inhibitor of cysteine peptidase